MSIGLGATMSVAVILAGSVLGVAAARSRQTSETVLRVVHPPVFAAQSRSRAFVPARIDTLWKRGTSSALASPTKLLPTSYGFVVQDGATHLAALTDHGKQLWVHDLSTDGINRISDLKVGLGDSVFVVDSPANKLIALDRAGAVVMTVSLARVGYVDSFAPLRDGTTIAITSDTINPFVVFDRTGGITSRSHFPWDQFAGMNPMARQAEVAVDPVHDTWSFGFAFGSRFFTFDRTGRRSFVGQFVDPVPFPDIIVEQNGANYHAKLGRATVATASLAQRGDELLVLFGGSDTTVAYRSIDRYSVKTGAYTSSYLLPGRARSIGVYGGRLFALTGQAIVEVRESGNR